MFPVPNFFLMYAYKSRRIGRHIFFFIKCKKIKQKKNLLHEKQAQLDQVSERPFKLG